MSALVAWAKFAAFSDAFLSGLVIPLIPTIIEARTDDYSPKHVQLWTSILIAAYGGGFVILSRKNSTLGILTK